jgi:hypothetical protein
MTKTFFTWNQGLPYCHNAHVSIVMYVIYWLINKSSALPAMASLRGA